MPSRADVSRAAPSRAALEWALRLVTLGALGIVLWRWTRPTPPTSSAVEVREAADTAALTRWTTTAVPAGHLAFAGAPDATTRDWLRALGAAGMRVSWSAGALDTVRVAGAGASLVAPAADEALVARVGATAATLPAPRPPRLGAVVVLGAAGWEAKFVAAALEERGWPVRLRVAVAPGLDVTQAAPNATLSPDTATTAAVVVLDSAAVDAATAARLARYVRDGGGLVLAGDGAATPALRALAPGGVGAVAHGVIGAIDGATPQRGLELLPVQPLRADGVALERRGADVAVAARRVGAGRVVQVGYEETWRWRMAAPDEAPAAHRAWWTRVVGAAAYAPTAAAPAPNDTGETQLAPAVSHTRSSSNDPAPLAGAIAALGPPSAAPSTARGRTPTGPRPSDGALAALAGAALLAEVASRRMRGAR